MFIFYDTETTGINATFDQILQFAAVLTDENFVEIERFEIRCQLLPWVVPSPTALLVTRTPVSKLDDKSLPTFYEMMAKIHDKLTSWQPAVFIGYNSVSFDENFLHRALWQSLYPPYLTVTNNNSRFDLLPVLRALHYFAPEGLIWPKNGKGKVTFKLDKIAPSNGFDHLNAHDALNDVEATIHIAKRMAEEHPVLWGAFLHRSQKSHITDILSEYRPVMIIDSTMGKSSAFFGQAVHGQEGVRSSATKLLDLNYDWTKHDSSDNSTDQLLKDLKKNSIQISHNKAPLIFSGKEAESLFEMELSEFELRQSQFLNSNSNVQYKILGAMKDMQEEWPKAEELEQMIYLNFISNEDASLARKLHAANKNDKLSLANQFNDHKLRNLAIRMLFVEQNAELTRKFKANIEGLIKRRHSPNKESTKWRSIKLALDELNNLKKDNRFSFEELNEIECWLNTRQSILD